MGGWIDWNMALDTEGGPNWAENQVDSPIIVNAEEDEFYKQPMFYATGHFSRFLPPGSRSVGLLNKEALGRVDSLAFLNPDNDVVAIFINR